MSILDWPILKNTSQRKLNGSILAVVVFIPLLLCILVLCGYFHSDKTGTEAITTIRYATTLLAIGFVTSLYYAFTKPKKEANYITNEEHLDFSLGH